MLLLHYLVKPLHTLSHRATKISNTFQTIRLIIIHLYMALKYSIKFVLLKPGIKNNETSLRCFVRYNYQQVAFSTGIKIEPRYFNIEKQRAEESSRFNGRDINIQLEQIRAFINSRFNKLVEFPSPKQFKEICDLYIKKGEIESDPSVNNNPTGLISFLRKIYEDSKSGVRLVPTGSRKGQPFQERSVRAYYSTIVVLEKFAKHEMVIDYPFNEVNDDFYHRFAKFFYEELQLSVGYFSSKIKYIKLAMNEAREKGLHKTNTHNSKAFVKPSYESDTIYLNIDTIKQLQTHVFKENEEVYENARDLFLVGCWTGLRFSDFSTLSAKDINDGVIRVKMQKTLGRVAIPLHPMLGDIIDKYNGFPRTISNQKLNQYIKIAARKAGLTQVINVKKNIAGQDKFVKMELCDLITTHTARRSFATNMFKKGIPTLLIMAITGHKTEAAFLKYIRVSNEEKAQMMAEIWKKIDWD